jgi:DNA-binding transcriptional ArsR family regulator
MKTLNLDIEKLVRTARQFRVVCHPDRQRIINLLSDKTEMNVTDIYEKLDMKQAESSHHLTLMLDYYILKKVRRGKMSIYSLNKDLLAKIIEHSDQLSKRV